MIRKNGLMVVITIILVGAITSITVTKRTHKDIVIKVDDKEYIVDSYSTRNNCIMFDYEDKTITVCGNFEIIE